MPFSPTDFAFIQTGKSKHYGFIEFDSSDVAQIVAETMDNYLLMGHIMRCKVIPKDEVHPELWVGANRKWRAVPAARLARAEHDKVNMVCYILCLCCRLTFFCRPAQSLSKPRLRGGC